MTFIDGIESLIPASVSEGERLDWGRIDNLFADSCLCAMKGTMQDPVFHAEGDVYTHTQMVCGRLSGDPRFHALTARRKAAVFLAAILHDIGKVTTTKREDGHWVSPHHSSAGSRIAREFLWKDCGLCGEADLISFRESVCALVRFHMLPIHLIDQENAGLKIRKAAAVGELASDFSWDMLCMLAEADIRGRLSDDIEEGLEKVEMARLMAEDAGCLARPYKFADSFTKHAYLSGRNVHPDQVLFNNSWGDIIMMSGLPGTGKDTWIRKYHPDLPVISLDSIRTELRINPTDNQGQVIRLAQERAKAYLRKKQTFVWNATDLTKDTRQKLIRLFEQYGASVRVVYLETDWNTRAERNLGRKDAVPETIIKKMLDNIVPPTPDEALTVEWVSV